jgi:radical SAM protein with 4Fe4S-binding SPASM domain
MKRDKGFMEMPLLREIVEQVKTHPPKSVGLHLFGESLLHKDLISAMRLIKANLKETKLLLSTNAFFLDAAVSKGIIDAGLDKIRFSLDGARRPTYEGIRRGSDFERVVGNVKEFIRIRNQAGAAAPLIQVQMIGMKDTGREARDFRRFWKALLTGRDRVIIQEFMTFAGRVEDRTRFKIASARDRLKRRLPCLRLWKNLVIYWDGRVTACCYDYDGELVIGDVRRESIAEIWNGGRIKSMRQAQLEGRKANFGLCHSCILQRPLEDENR